MSSDEIESDLPDLTGVTLAELRTNSKYGRAARQLAEQLKDQPDEGVISCCSPLQIELPDEH